MIDGVDADARACLLLGDREVACARAGMFLTAESFTQGASQQLSEDVVMNVPGLGLYHGVADAMEYASIMSDPKFNRDYHTFLQQLVSMERSDARPDTLHMLIHMVSAWENFTRVSTPIYNNT